MSRLYKAGLGAAQSFDWAADAGLSDDLVRPRLSEPPAEKTPSVPDAEPEVPATPPPPDLDRIRKQAFEEGFQAGRETTEKSCEQAYAQQLASFGGIVERAAQFKKGLRSEVEEEVVDLAFAVARRILRRELQTDPETTRGIVKAGIERASKNELNRIRVHPEDFAMVRGEVDDSVDVVSDETVSRGGAVFETSEGRLDARIETQLDEIERGLADR